MGGSVLHQMKTAIMTKVFGFIAFAVMATTAHAGNFATCILDKMPGSSNGATHAAVWRSCSNEFPGRFTGVEQGTGRGLFGFDDGNACTIKKAASTTYAMSANTIGVACRCLYDKPNPFDKPDLQDSRPVMCAPPPWEQYKK